MNKICETDSRPPRTLLLASSALHTCHTSPRARRHPRRRLICALGDRDGLLRNGRPSLWRLDVQLYNLSLEPHCRDRTDVSETPGDSSMALYHRNVSGRPERSRLRAVLSCRDNAKPKTRASSKVVTECDEQDTSAEQMSETADHCACRLKFTLVTHTIQREAKTAGRRRVGRRPIPSGHRLAVHVPTIDTYNKRTYIARTTAYSSAGLPARCVRAEHTPAAAKSPQRSPPLHVQRRHFG